MLEEESVANFFFRGEYGAKYKHIFWILLLDKNFIKGQGKANVIWEKLSYFGNFEVCNRNQMEIVFPQNF